MQSWVSSYQCQPLPAVAERSRVSGRISPKRDWTVTSDERRSLPAEKVLSYNGSTASNLNNTMDWSALEKLAIKLRNVLINMASCKMSSGHDLYLSICQKLTRSLLVRFLETHENGRCGAHRIVGICP
eukprot:scpid98570/ scgid12155/ 